jgi:SAM-dependent methyltransferase
MYYFELLAQIKKYSLSALRKLSLLSLSFSKKIKLHNFAFKIYEIFMSIEFSSRVKNFIFFKKNISPEDLPVPPPPLIVSVDGNASIREFIETGIACFNSIMKVLQSHKVDSYKFSKVLDFGCGCGRVTRYWNRFKDINVYGTDYNFDSIKWCISHLGFAKFKKNNLSPPLDYNDKEFDFIYSISVFTHLTENLQFEWFDELYRILKSPGYLLISTHGDSYSENYTKKQQEEYKNGKLVVRFDDSEGTNLCSTLHPEHFIKEKLARKFKLIDFVPSGEEGGKQDFSLFKKI